MEPGTGRVLAYYGGENGAGLDLASDAGPSARDHVQHRHRAAAVESGFDIWSPELDGSSPQTFPTYLDEEGRPRELVNIGGASDDAISLADAVTEKLDTPIYAVAEQIGGDVIAASAARLGIDRMWDPHALDEHGIAAEIAADDPEVKFEPDLGIGAYPITVLDAASMHATLAAQGIAAEPYFVERVTGPEGQVFDASPDLDADAVDPGLASELTMPSTWTRTRPGSGPSR